MTDGTATLTSNGGDAGAGGNGGGGAPPWYGADLAPELKTWVDGKSYKDLPTALSAHMAAERLIGAPAERLLRLPDKPDAPEWGDVWSRLGRPAKAEEYELPLPQGDDGAFAKRAAQWFHEAGMPKPMAQRIAKNWNEFIATSVREAEEKDQRDSAAALATLRGEWGGAAGEREELGRRALATFGKQAGLEDTDLIRLENAIGTVKMLKLFSEVGKLTGESTFRGNNGGGGFSMTKDEAQSKLAQLRADPEWSQAYLRGDKNKLEEMTQLQQIIAAT